MTKRERLNYIAGFIDGEGCINITWPRKKNSFFLRVSIANTDLGLLKSVKKDLGIGGISLKRPSKKSRFKSYQYWVAGCKALLVLKKLLPFLRGKKEEALLGIKFQEEKTRFSKSLNDTKGLSQKVISKREKIYWKMKALKSARKIRIKGGELKN